MIEPVGRRSILHPGVRRAGMVENHIHHNLESALMGLLDKKLPFLVRTEARIDPVIVGRGISVIRAARHIIFKHGTHPEGRHSERIEIVEMLTDAPHIAAVATIRVLAVRMDRMTESFIEIVAVGHPLRKPVGHQKIEHVGSIETPIFLGAPIAGFQLVRITETFSSNLIVERHFPGLRVGRDGEIKELIVRAVKAHLLRDADSGIVYREGGLRHIRALYHQLQRVVCHSNPPVRGLDA